MSSKNQTENLNKDGNLPLRKGYTLNPYQETLLTYEKKSGKKLTVPDQSLTIKQILDRHTRGQRIPDQLVGYYDDENDPLDLQGVNIETLDLSEKYDLLNRVKRQTSDLKTRYKNQEDAKNISKLKEQLTKEISQQNQPSQHIDS